MILIDTVYQKVLAIANKEQRGYVTPQEFNLFANQAQMEIFEQYFYDINQFKRLPGNLTEYSDIVNILEEKPKLMQKIHGWIIQFQTGLNQLREKREIATKAFLVTLVIWINASIRFGLIVYAVTGNFEAAGLIILASGLVYSIGTFLPFGVGNIAIATLVLSAADIDEAQAITIGIVEVATSLTLSVPMGILSMGITGMPEEEEID